MPFPARSEVRFTDEVAPPPPVLRHQPKLLRLMNLRTRQILRAALEAARLADLPTPAGPECAVVVGLSQSTLGAPDLAAALAHHPHLPAFQAWQTEIPPLWMLHWLPNLTAAHLAIQLGASGPAHTLAAPSPTLWQETTTLAREFLEAHDARTVLTAIDAGDYFQAAVFSHP